MGLRGPKPVPTALLKLRGSFVPGRREGEPSPAPGIPECPAFASPRMREHWMPICELLMGLGLISAPFSAGALLLCDALADWIHWSAKADDVLTDANDRAHDRKAKAWERTLKAL